jgi:ADP-ribose pyrophosphatase YjhB (NUDIX family)
MCAPRIEGRNRVECGEEKAFAGSQVQHTFDHPNRGSRGRVIAEVFGIRLEDSRDLMLSGIRSRDGDDAKGALRMDIYESYRQPERAFEDHLSIIEWFQDNLEEKLPFTFRAEATRWSRGATKEREKP